MTGPALTAGTVPVGPMLSMFDPIYVGIDEFGQPVYIRVIYKNLLAAGEPGGGKSGLLNTLAAHAALSVRQPAGAVRRQASRARHVGRHRRRIRRPRPRPRHHHPAAAAEGDGQPVRLAAAPTAAARSNPATASPSSPRSSTRSPCYSTVLGTEHEQRRVHLPVPRPGSPRPRRRHARHRRHPAALGGHHPQEPARPVRLPRRVPLHLHRLQRHHPRRRPVRRRIHRHRHRPVQPRRMPAHRRRRHPRSGSRSPTCPTPTSSPWPTTPPGPAAPRLPPHRRPGHRRRLTRHP